MSGSSTSCTLTPHTEPVIWSERGLRCAAAKNSSNVVPSSRWAWSCAASKPVSHSMTSSTSSRVRPLRYALVT